LPIPGANQYSVRRRRTPQRELLAKIDAEGSPAEVLKQSSFALMEAVDPLKQMTRATAADRKNYEFLISLGEIFLHEKKHKEYEVNLQQIKTLRGESPVPKALQSRLDKVIKAKLTSRDS
jgi:hypothetical protein